MNLLRQISIYCLAALIGIAQISSSVALGGSRIVAAPQQVGNALHQVKQQQDQGLFGIAEQRGASVFSQHTSKPPAPANPLFISHPIFIHGIPYLAKLRHSLHFWRLPLGLEVSDIIFPFHTFW